jgi:hypothetical protein
VNRHRHLTDVERRALDGLIRRAAPALGPEDGELLCLLFRRQLADAQHSRRRAVELDRKLSQLRAESEPLPSDGPAPIPRVRAVS